MGASGSITTYPTPVISDSIETEMVSVGSGKYQALEYGTRWTDVEHGGFPKDLPDHVLVFDGPADKDGLIRRRIWVNSRVDQDIYNFNIEFEGDNPNYPIYTHQYILPREGYTPKEPLSVSPLDPNARLISEKLQNETDPQELSSRYVSVIRVYHTLPGQITYTIEFPYGGIADYPRINTKQKVAVGTAMPLQPGSACPVIGYQNAILLQQQTGKTENGNIDEVSSVYEIVPPIEAQAGIGYNVAHHGSDTQFPYVEWQLVALRNNYKPGNTGDACPIYGYEDLVLVDEKFEAEQTQSVVNKVNRRYERMPSLLMWQTSYDNNQVEYPIIKTAQRRLRSTFVPGKPGDDNCPIEGFEHLILFEQHMMPTDIYSIVEHQCVYERSPNGVIVTHDFDAQMNTVVKTARQKVPSGKVPVIEDFTLHFEEQPVDKWRTLQIITSLRELPPDKVEFQTGKYAFPTLLTGIALQKVELTDETNSAVIWYPNTLRPLQNVPAVFKITTSFHLNRPPNVDVFVLPTRDLVFRGRSFQVAINNVLTDKISLSVSFSGDATYGDLTEGITFEATNPTATDYYKAIGSLQTVGCDITRLRANIWVLQQTEVILA